MQLTYNNQSLLATGCYEAEDCGITRMGPSSDQGNEPRWHGGGHESFRRPFHDRGGREISTRPHRHNPRQPA